MKEFLSITPLAVVDSFDYPNNQNAEHAGRRGNDGENQGASRMNTTAGTELLDRPNRCLALFSFSRN
jgi:hypothetical protein